MESTVTISLFEYEQLKKCEQAIKKRKTILTYGYSSVYYIPECKEDSYLVRELIEVTKKIREKDEKLEKANKKKWRVFGL